MHRKWFALVLVVASVACAMAFGAANAKAAASDCQSTYLCVWWDSGFAGSRYQFAGNNSSWSAWAIQDDDSSWFNNGTSGLRVQVYKDSGYANTTVCVGYKQQISFNSFANDKGSSNLWNGC
jgi:hypothetical protein